ncbi:MAG: P pilus assembly protein, chaperone PapD [Nostocaceae cyanobacterium]|nr:P pilus assembly protein, chaperone PapD [Nostocaceae cyanobacterium]
MFNKTHKFISYFSGCALSTLVLFAGIAQAQVKVSPIVIEAEAKKGQARGIVQLTNTGDKVYRARVYAQPFTYTQNGFKTVESSPNDLTPYLIFSPRELVIQPGQTRQIRMNSRLLSSMKEGEYRAVIFTESLDEIKQQEGKTVSIKPRFGIPVYVRHGKTSPNLTVKSASFNPQQKNIQLLVSNSGSASARPQAEWTLKQGETQIGTGEVNNTTVIAEGERYILIPFSNGDKQVSAGNYQLSGNLIWGDKNKKLPFQFDVTISPEQAAAANKPKEQPGNRNR